MKQRLAIAVVISVTLRLLAQSAWEPTFTGAWSESVTSDRQLTLSARLVVSVETDNSGSQTALAYVEIRNTNLLANTIYLYHESEEVPQLTCQLRGADGKDVHGFEIALWGEMLPGYWLALPYDSIIRFRPFPREFKAHNGEREILGGLKSWRISPGDTNDYYLSGTLTLAIPQDFPPPHDRDRYVTNNVFGVRQLPPTPTSAWQGTLKLPPVKISARTPQRDDSTHRGSTSLNYRDADSGITFSVESDLRHVVATEKDGTVLWRRQPGTDGNLPPYSESRPQTNPAVSWIGALTKEQSESLKNTGSGKFIGVRFNSRQGGFLDVKNGNFIFQGQD